MIIGALLWNYYYPWWREFLFFKFQKKSRFSNAPRFETIFCMTMAKDSQHLSTSNILKEYKKGLETSSEFIRSFLNFM